jgi:hypothetical protein
MEVALRSDQAAVVPVTSPVTPPITDTTISDATYALSQPTPTTRLLMRKAAASRPHAGVEIGRGARANLIGNTVRTKLFPTRRNRGCRPNREQSYTPESNPR